MINTFQELHNRFDAIAHSAHNVTRSSSGAVGELFEKLMVGKIVGNQKGADFASIETEAKVHYGNSETTLFGFAPKRRTGSITAAQFAFTYGSSRVRANVVNSYGHSLKVNAKSVKITVDGKAVTGWTVAELSERIAEKMPNLAIVKATKTGNRVTYDRMTVCRHIIASRFIDSIRNGDVVVEVRGSQRGVIFRAMPSIIEGWFEVLH